MSEGQDLIYYAIGDVHGELTMLIELLGCIRGDAAFHGALHKIVFLGDLIDRGAGSRGVVETAMSLQQAGEAIVIRGNHEELMLHGYDHRENAGVYWWATNGGDETIASYQLVNGPKDDWRDAVDKAHINWLRSLPTIWRDETRGLVFVHGGIDPQTFPNEDDEVRLWTRSPKFFHSERWPVRDEVRDILVVHGHTPTDDFKAEVQRRRINVDTGACFGGPLTSVALAPGQAPRFLYARRP